MILKKIEEQQRLINMQVLVNYLLLCLAKN